MESSGKELWCTAVRSREAGEFVGLLVTQTVNLWDPVPGDLVTRELVRDLIGQGVRVVASAEGLSSRHSIVMKETEEGGGG